ncbi:hypothetical protein [Corynebacterium sp. CCM 9203]|uniref:RipA family octameric membrane protein n=1 Tax=Corynebacterium sp. CCM 9203 TaxID=3057615 RepID=UPI0035231F40
MSDKNRITKLEGIEAYKDFFLNYKDPWPERSIKCMGMETGEIDVNRDDRLKNLLKIAHETRNFEIELYWRRATYYWGFMVAIFAGLKWGSDGSDVLEVLFSLLGVLFAVGWYWSSLGSKYWQENWEYHVTVLEVISEIPIHSVRKLPNKRKCLDPLRAYPYSVSKINHLLSLSVVLFWLCIFTYSVSSLFDGFAFRNAFTVASIIVVVFLLYGMRAMVRSEVVKIEWKDMGGSRSGVEEVLRFSVGYEAGSSEKGAFVQESGKE